MKLSALCALVFATSLAATEAKRNVLFIMVDDLRPEMENYTGNPDSFRLLGPGLGLSTPQLNELAKESMVMTNNYAQQALCCPSRTSIMTGRYPATNGMTMCGYWRDKAENNHTSMPQYFKEQGYKTVGMGKLYHPGKEEGDDDKEHSWSGKEYFHPTKHYNVRDSWASKATKASGKEKLQDELIKNAAKEKIKEFAASGYENEDKNFFLGVGFLKPHLPFVYPNEYHDDACIDNINMPPNPYFPIDAPNITWSSYGEMRAYNDISPDPTFNMPLSDTKTKELRCAYRACVRYIDAMIGEVLNELNKHTALKDNTVVAFQSDHGFQLGEHNEWAKQTTFDLALRIPFMLKVPGVTETLENHVFDQLAEGIDTFPTLVAAAGIKEVDPCAGSCEHTCHDGRNLLELIDGADSWRTAAYSWYPRDGRMGYTFFSSEDNMRCTAWPEFKKRTMSGNMTNLADEWKECYDHATDPEENTNIYGKLDADAKARVNAHFDDLSHWGTVCKTTGTRSNAGPSVHSSIGNSLLKDLKDYLMSLL